MVHSKVTYKLGCTVPFHGKEPLGVGKPPYTLHWVLAYERLHRTTRTALRNDFRFSEVCTRMCELTRGHSLIVLFNLVIKYAPFGDL